MIGYISKIETMSLLDGPGLRVVVFLQGCLMRCQFCHNPETWSVKTGRQMTSQELVDFILRYRNYFGKTGGVTFSGGEPLLQKEFLLETLKKCSEFGIHTCLDTSGVGEDYEEILSYTDLVLLDVKALTEEDYQKMTLKSMKYLNTFLETSKQNKIWIRQVIIPGINDNKKYIERLKKFLSPYSNIEKIELLPYHTLGISKYKTLNIPYSFENIKAMDAQECEKLKELLK